MSPEMLGPPLQHHHYPNSMVFIEARRNADFAVYASFFSRFTRLRFRHVGLKDSLSQAQPHEAQRLS